APDRMTITLRTLLYHECEPGGDLLYSGRFQERPILPFEELQLVQRQRCKVLLDLSAVARINDQADLLDAAVQSLLNDELDGRLTDAIAVHEGQHFFLNCGGRRIHPGATPGCGNDRFAYSG